MQLLRWFYGRTMFAYHEFYDGRSSSIGRAAGAIAAILALCALLAFAPRHDTTKVVGGAQCSILSEDQISAVLGTPMRLMPTTGAVCHYVSTETGGASALFVIARREPPTSASATGLNVRYGSRWYVFTVVPNGAGVKPLAEEIRLAKLVRRGVIAQNR
jgi:hypothetical protein